MPVTKSTLAIKYGVLDPLRRLCESHQLDYFVIIQTNSPTQPIEYWNSSKRLRNLCGDQISTCATYMCAGDDDDHENGNEAATVDADDVGEGEDVGVHAKEGELNDDEEGNADEERNECSNCAKENYTRAETDDGELKMEVEDDDITGAVVAEVVAAEATAKAVGSFHPSSLAPSKDWALASKLPSKATVPTVKAMESGKAYRVNQKTGVAAAEEECILLPAEDFEDEDGMDEDNERTDEEEDGESELGAGDPEKDHEEFAVTQKESGNGREDKKQRRVVEVSRGRSGGGCSNCKCRGDRVLSERIRVMKAQKSYTRMRARYGVEESTTNTPTNSESSTAISIHPQPSQTSAAAVTAISTTSKPLGHILLKHDIIARATSESNTIPSFHVLRGKNDPPQRDDDPNARYLDDDLDEHNELHSSGKSSSITSSATLPIRYPIIWKTHRFDRPFRPSTVKRLFEDKVVYSRFVNRHLVGDHEYVGLLSSLIKKSNPYCVVYPKSLCCFRIGADNFFAEFLCRYDSCYLQSQVRIACGSNEVFVDYFMPKTRAPRSQSVDSIFINRWF